MVGQILVALQVGHLLQQVTIMMHQLMNMVIYSIIAPKLLLQFEPAHLSIKNYNQYVK